MNNMNTDASARPSLHELDQSGSFVLVNVHDVGSAALARAAGAQAVATTSGGHAYTIGRRDAVGAPAKTSPSSGRPRPVRRLIFPSASMLRTDGVTALRRSPRPSRC